MISPRMTTPLQTAGSATLLWALVSGAVAAPVLGNLGVARTDRAVPVSYNSWQASSFRLAETAGPWRVKSVTLRLAQDVPNASFTVRIVGESSLRPALSDVRASFRTPVLISGATTATPGSAAAPVVFDAAVSPDPVLQPGQIYWLVAGVTQQDGSFTPATGLYYWSYANTGAADAGGAGGWQFGVNTASAGTLGAGWAAEATTPFTFSIDAVPDIPVVTLASWRLTHPGGPVDAAAFLASDQDGDGLNGLLEFAFNGSPTQPGLELPRLLEAGPGRIGLQFVRWVNAPELRYDVQWSGDLGGWETIPAAAATTAVVAVGDGTERVSISILQSSLHRFLRVRIIRL